MKITVITLFPEVISCFITQSIVKRAVEKNHVDIEIINIRDFAKDSYKTVDGRPYGGGAGMILMAEPIVAAIRMTKFQIPNSKQTQNAKVKNIKTKIILTSPRGKTYTQEKAREYSKLDHLILVAGHYEGVDERVMEYIDEEVSVGDFVMTGGEITAAGVVDSVVRLLPGVLKKESATQDESFSRFPIESVIKAVGLTEELSSVQKKGATHVTLLEYPHYTRPEKIKIGKGPELIVPEVLLSGNHAQIQTWRLRAAYEITKKRRPDLLK